MWGNDHHIIINKQLDAFFLKQSTFGNNHKMKNRINLTIKEIENNLLNMIHLLHL